MYKLNLTIINKIVCGVSKEPQRYYLNGIHIFDKDGARYYEATDGHICFRVTDAIEEDTLPADYIIKIQSPIKTKLKYGELVIADEETAVIKADTKCAFDIIDGSYPDINNILPKNREFAKDYTMFDPDYLEKLIKAYGSMQILSVKPCMEDSKCVAMWEWEDDNVQYTALLMPLRLED